jgi:hypothetical protein
LSSIYIMVILNFFQYPGLKVVYTFVPWPLHILLVFRAISFTVLSPGQPPSLENFCLAQHCALST